MKYLRIHPEYECSPLWVMNNSDIYENCDINSTNFDTELKNKLVKWSSIYDSTLNQDYPPDSKFNTAIEEENFENEGYKIWELITKRHTSEFNQISYYSVIFKKAFINIEEYINEISNHK